MSKAIKLSVLGTTILIKLLFFLLVMLFVLIILILDYKQYFKLFYNLKFFNVGSLSIPMLVLG